MDNAPATSIYQVPAWFWLLVAFCGVLSILFAAFGLVFDDMSGGPNEKNVFFWMFEGFFALVGLFLIVFGLILLARAEVGKSSHMFWSFISICGMLSILFAFFCFVVYAANNGNMGLDMGGVIFWAFIGLFALLGMFLIGFGSIQSRKALKEKAVSS
jgi:hypothetical protein